METKNFKVIGMHCGNCANTVKNVLMNTPNVNKATVDYESTTAIVEFSGDLNEQLVNKALGAFGDFKLSSLN